HTLRVAWCYCDSARWSERASRQLPPQLVEEVQQEGDYDGALGCSRGFGIDQHRKALAIGSQVQVGKRARVRELLVGPQPGLFALERIAARRLVCRHDAPTQSFIEQVPAVTRPDGPLTAAG